MQTLSNETFLKRTAAILRKIETLKTLDALAVMSAEFAGPYLRAMDDIRASLVEDRAFLQKYMQPS